MHCKPALWPRTGTQLAAVECSPFAHSDQSKATLTGNAFRIPSRSVVENIQIKLCDPVSESDAGRFGFGMLAGVGQRLLNDSIGRHFENRRKNPHFASDRQVHGQLCLPRFGDQIAELGEARLRNKLVGLVGAAKEPEEAM